MQYRVKIFARIGELMQGILPNHAHFMVSGIPSMQFFTEAVLEDAPATATLLQEKTLRALHFLLRAHTAKNQMYNTIISDEALASALLAGKKISIHSNIPSGKGLSSSSADILSFLFVVNDFLRAGFSTNDLYAIAVQVEPTDPCLSDDIVLFRQREGWIDRSLLLPALAVVYFDCMPDQQVLTLEIKRNYNRQQVIRFEHLLNRFITAANQQDYACLFDCITQSAICNQDIIPLPHFDQCLKLAEAQRAGMMVAHSGTIIGFVTAPHRMQELLQKVRQLATRYPATTVYAETWEPR